MRALLISPANIKPVQAELPLEIDEEIGAIPSLGLMYLAQAVKDQKRHEISILDGRVEHLSKKKYMDRILSYKPDLVGITAMSFTLNNVIDTARLINEKIPKTYVCLGGPHVKYYPQESLALKGARIDYIVKGEGEKIFPQLLDCIEDKILPEKLEGVGYKKDGKIIINQGEGCIDSLDSLRWPNRKLIPYRLCYSILGNGEIMTTIQMSRGCPYNCIYCDEALSKYRKRSVQDVIDEIGHCMSLGIEDFFFIDDLFTVDKKWVLAFCDILIEKRTNIRFKISARVNTLESEMIERLKKAGCYRIHFGIESGSQRILDILQKRVTLREQQDAIKMTKKAGIRTLCYFIIGAPTETREEILKTIEYAICLDPDYAHFSILTPYPATQLYKKGLDEGAFSRDFWQEFAQDPSDDFVPELWSGISREELMGLQRYANKRFYSRSKVFVRELLNTRSIAQFIRKTRTGIRILFSSAS